MECNKFRCSNKDCEWWNPDFRYNCELKTKLTVSKCAGFINNSEKFNYAKFQGDICKEDDQYNKVNNEPEGE